MKTTARGTQGWDTLLISASEILFYVYTRLFLKLFIILDIVDTQSGEIYGRCKDTKTSKRDVKT